MLQWVLIGIAGAIYIKGVAVTKYKRFAVSDTDEWPSKYSKVFIELDDGLELSLTDKRRFAKVLFILAELYLRCWQLDCG
ncbi:putative DNA-(apurinic or apyrimidinic site) lyase, DNA-formamidopyrimidine glycosylase [Helianthus debilis subsp. tardiflorus]